MEEKRSDEVIHLLRQLADTADEGGDVVKSLVMHVMGWNRFAGLGICFLVTGIVNIILAKEKGVVA